jgi:hypothetical protein
MPPHKLGNGNRITLGTQPSTLSPSSVPARQSLQRDLIELINRSQATTLDTFSNSPPRVSLRWSMGSATVETVGTGPPAKSRAKSRLLTFQQLETLSTFQLTGGRSTIP